MTDSELLQQLRLGDREAFSALFREYYPLAVRTVEGMVRERAIAEELVQDVFVELWDRRKSLRFDESFRAYLFRSARNRALNHLRHQRVQTRAEPLLASPSATPAGAFSEMIDREIDAAVESAIQRLPERCAEIFRMSRFDGLKYREIADALGISQKGVEAQMGKALKLLRDELARYLPDPTPD